MMRVRMVGFAAGVATVLGLFIQTSSPVSAQAKTDSRPNWQDFADPYSQQRGNCPRCKIGEAMAETRMALPHGIYVSGDNPPCGDPSYNVPKLPDALKPVLSKIFYSQGPALGTAGSFALGFSDQIIAAGVKWLAENPSTAGAWFRSTQPNVSSCVRVAVVLPKSVHVTRTEAEGTNGKGGWAGLAYQPIAEPIDENLFAMVTVAKNWSHDTDGTAYLRVFYTR
jgi:hypothetical protein